MYQLEYAHLGSIRCLDFGSPDAKMTTKSRTYVMELAGIGHARQHQVSNLEASSHPAEGAKMIVLLRQL